MTEPLEHFGLDRTPFADEPHAGGVIGTRALRKLVARIQSALRDGQARIGVCGASGIGKSSLATALPKLFAGNTRVATLLDPADRAWPIVRVDLARAWQLEGERLSRASLVAAAALHRLVLVVDRAEETPEAVLGHLDALQEIRDGDGATVVTVILFVKTSDDALPAKPPALAWLERSGASVLPFEPLSPDSVADYIERRLRRSGYRGAPLFTPRAALAIHAETAGVPGAVSRLCDQLLADAAARRLRSIDEPFVRSRERTPQALASLVREDLDHAWDDADHHPRETGTGASELLLDHAIAPPATCPALAVVQPAGLGEEEVADPELEAYLSAPPTAAELRAIRGGFVRRSLWPFALVSGAVALGGVLLALVLGRGPTAPAAEGDPSADLDARRGDALDASLGESSVDPSDSVPPVLGRIRGPVLAPPPAAAPLPRRRPDATPRSNRAGEAMAGDGTPLVPAGELDVDLDGGIEGAADAEALWAPARTGIGEDEADSDTADYRPPDLVPPARIDDVDM